MSTKTKTTLAAAVMLVLALIPLALQSHALALINEQNDELAGQNAKLQAEADQLKARIRDVVAGAKPAPGAPVASDYLLVDLDAIENMANYLSPLNGLEPSAEAIAWLGLTPDEVTEIQTTLHELDNRAENYARAHVQAIPIEQGVAIMAEMDPNLLDIMSGAKTAYAIPPMSAEEYASLQEWLSEKIADAIGPRRAAIFLPEALRLHPDLLSPGLNSTFIFRDYIYTDGTIRTYYFDIYKDRDGQIGASGSDFETKQVKDEWSDLHFPGPHKITLPSP